MSLSEDEGHMGLFTTFKVFSLVDDNTVAFETRITLYNQVYFAVRAYKFRDCGTSWDGDVSQSF